MLIQGDRHMFGWLVDAVKGLIGGKGGTQIGNRNQSVSDVSFGGNVIGNTNVANTINNFPGVTPEPNVEVIPFQPTTEEYEILRALSHSNSTPLQYIKSDLIPERFEVQFAGKSEAFLDQQAAVRYHEAFTRLAQNGIIVETTQGSKFYVLAPVWRGAVEKVLAANAGASKQLPPHG
jgi:hypothetical protein